ncbi:Outer mitochondrial membrane transport complex protein domain containing protein [Aphelenchoides besseyi]|nr:Outer mitochondrial membrane transport complex protein domain containing protein [Aphelenchoides besseyi]
MFRQKELLVPGWKENVINLIQFPRCGCIPTISPYALKLETWFRFNKLNYTVMLRVERMKTFTDQAKVKFLFIEHNGRQIADSNFIIDHLKKTMELNIDRNLSTQERADERAYHVLIGKLSTVDLTPQMSVEDSLLRTMVYFRGQDFKWLATEDGLLRNFSGVKKFLFKNLIHGQIQNSVIYLDVYNN